MLRYKIGIAVLVALALACGVGIALLLGQSPAREGERTAGPSEPVASGPGSPSPSGEGGATHSAPAPPGGVPANAEAARVVRLVDGDTVRVVGDAPGGVLDPGVETVVRLLEIDTPESVDPNSPLQCYAKRATARLEHLIPVGSRVWILPDQELIDPYGRTLLYMWGSAGGFVNLQMVRSGAAKAVLYEPNDAFINLLRRAEGKARSLGRGLWGACAYFGEPVRLTGPAPGATPSPTAQGASVDRRYQWCYEANDAGLGNYVRGRDLEYAWYEDEDSDGVACEF